MTQPEDDSLGAGLMLEDRLSLRLLAPDDGPQAGQGLQRGNEDTLRALLALDTRHVEPGDEGPELAHELERLETKINLILELVGQVLARQIGMPPAVPVRLSARKIEWQAHPPVPPAGQPVLVELYLSPHFPRPLYLFATVREVTGNQVHAAFADPGEIVGDLLEQYIFRQHRRQVAASRRGGHSS